MKPSTLLTITSLVSILLMIFHISDEIARGLEPGGLNMALPLLIVGAAMYGTVVLAGRRTGYVIMLVVAGLGVGIPVIHMSGTTGLIGGKIAVDSSGSFFWVWQNMTLGIVSAFNIIVAVRCLWNPGWAEDPIFRG